VAALEVLAAAVRYEAILHVVIIGE